MNDISRSIPKLDSVPKAFGNERYVNDIRYENALYAKTLRSPHAKARIVRRRYPELPAGYHIIDHTHVPGENVVNIIADDQPVFAADRVTYYQEPILLVIGPDKRVVLKLMKDIHIEYDIEVPQFEWTDSVVHYHFTKGNLAKVKEQADKVIRREYHSGYQEQLYIEPQGMIGYHDGKQVILEGSLQCPYYVKNALIRTLNCADDYVRVRQATVGGAFGGKEEFPSLIACQLAVAIEVIRKPIRLIYEREEDVESTTKRHPSHITMTAYVKDNEILGIQSEVGLDGGANIGLSGVVLSRALIATTGVYTIDHLDVTGDVYRTNTVPNGAFRGFGAPQMLFAVEMFMHHVAAELKVDALAFRQRYLAKQGDHTSTGGTFRDPIIMPEMLSHVLDESDYLNKRERYASPDSHRGIGMSWVLHGCGFTGSGEATHIKARVKLHKRTTDEVEILIAAVDMGQGVKTTMTKLVATILDVPLSQVIYDNPDTNFVPDSGPTVASRTMMIVGGLVARAARRLRDEWNAGEDQWIEERYVQPDYIKWDETTFHGDAYPAYSWGINIVEVEVDPATYEVTVLETWNIYDVGKAIDEQVILGQADGGQLQGLGLGYLEVMNHKQGVIQQRNVTDYIISTSVDTPPMHNYLMDNPYPLGPYGAKGAGELTLVGGAPAVALAIEQAIGKEIHEIPVTPERIMELMNDE